jgi:hypothetical protein
VHTRQQVVKASQVFPKPFCPTGFKQLATWNATSAAGDMKIKV